MLETTHALVAGAIASHMKDPVTAIGLSFLSHYILDAIPHWDFGTNWRQRRKLYTGLAAIADMGTGYVIAYVLFSPIVPLPLLFTAVTAAMIPDCLEAPWYMFFANHEKRRPTSRAGLFEKLTFSIYRLESFFHNKTTVLPGILTQAITLTFFLLLLQ